MEHELKKQAGEKMDKSFQSFNTELTHIRTGRATPALLDGIDVEVYGTKMKINQVATVAIPEPRLILLTPWDKSQMQAIEKGILASPLDLTPNNDGEAIRLPLPQLTEERRKELVKVVHKFAEEARVSIRNIRRHLVDQVKKDQKTGTIPEDDAHKLTAEIQEQTDSYIHKIEESLKAKEAEIMEV